MIQDRRFWESGEISMGRNYYKQRRDEYAGDVCVAKRIKGINEDDECDENLFEALLSLRKRNCDPVPLTVWLGKQELANQKCAVAVMGAMLDLRPNVGQLKYEVPSRTLRWAASVDFAAKYPGIWTHVMPHFATDMGRNYILMKANGGQRTDMAAVGG